MSPTDEGQELTSETSLDNKIWGIVHCVFCKKRPTNSTEEVVACQLLECCHTICGPCSEAWPEGETRECPGCRIQLNRTFLEHKILQELVEIPEATIDDDHCSLHSMKYEYYCVGCKLNVCRLCVKAHSQLAYTKQHLILDKELYSSSNNSEESVGKFPCRNHKSEQLTIYCKSCNELTCPDCQLSSHKDHSYDFIKDMAKDVKVSLLGMLLKTKFSFKVKEQALNILEKRKKDLYEQKMKIREDIASFGTKLRNAVEECLNRMNKDLNDKCNAIANRLENYSNALYKGMLPLEHTSNFIEVVLRQSTNTSVVYSRGVIRQHFEKTIASQIHEVPRPSYQENIEFETKDITGVFDEMGTIRINQRATGPESSRIEETLKKSYEDLIKMNEAINCDKEGEALFASMVSQAMGTSEAAETDPRQFQMEPEETRIHVATNLFATNEIPTQCMASNAGNETSWHTPQPPAAGPNDSTSSYGRWEMEFESVNSSLASLESQLDSWPSLPGDTAEIASVGGLARNNATVPQDQINPATTSNHSSNQLPASTQQLGNPQVTSQPVGNQPAAVECQQLQQPYHRHQQQPQPPQKQQQQQQQHQQHNFTRVSAQHMASLTQTRPVIPQRTENQLVIMQWGLPSTTTVINQNNVLLASREPPVTPQISSQQLTNPSVSIQSRQQLHDQNVIRTQHPRRISPKATNSQLPRHPNPQLTVQPRIINPPCATRQQQVAPYPPANYVQGVRGNPPNNEKT